MEKHAKEGKTALANLRRSCQWSLQLKNKCRQDIYNTALKKKKKTEKSRISMKPTKKYLPKNRLCECRYVSVAEESFHSRRDAEAAHTANVLLELRP
jgi:hypothetical protein